MIAYRLRFYYFTHCLSCAMFRDSEFVFCTRWRFHLGNHSNTRLALQWDK